MSISVSIQNVDALDNIVIVSGVLIATGNYVTGGDTVDFTKAVQDPLFSGLQPNIPSSKAPQCFDIWSAGGNLTRAYFPVTGTQQNNCKVKMNASAGSGSELSAGAYPSDVLTDTINFACQFPKFQ